MRVKVKKPVTLLFLQLNVSQEFITFLQVFKNSTANPDKRMKAYSSTTSPELPWARKWVAETTANGSISYNSFDSGYSSSIYQEHIKWIVILGFCFMIFLSILLSYSALSTWENWTEWHLCKSKGNHNKTIYSLCLCLIAMLWCLMSIKNKYITQVDYIHLI